MPLATQQELRDRLRVFKHVAAAESLNDLPVRMKDIWQTYESFHFNGNAPVYSITVMRREGPTAVGLMCKAASKCLALLGQQGINEDGSFVMPHDAATVTCVRMLLHMLARFVSDWVFSSEDEQAYKDSSKVAAAIQDAGLMPLLCKACSLLAHSMQQQQHQGQQQNVDQEQQKPHGMPPITLACELMNTWKVLTGAITHDSRGLSILSHELTAPSVRPAAELALAILRCWDGSEPHSSIYKRGAVNAAGVLGKDTNMPIEECWRTAVMAAAGSGDCLASGWHFDTWAAEQRRNGSAIRASTPPEPREAKALDVLSAAEVSQLLLFHVGLVAQTMKVQTHADTDDDDDSDSGSCASGSNSGSDSGSSHHHLQLESYIRLFQGLGMPAVAAYGGPVVTFHQLGPAQVSTALQAAYQSCFMRSQAAAVAATATQSWGSQNVSAKALARLKDSAIPAGLHTIVAEIVLSLVRWTRPQRGQEALKVLTYGLDLLSLVLNEWLRRQQIAWAVQQNQQEPSQQQREGLAAPGAASASAGGPSSTGASTSSVSSSDPASLLGALLTHLGAACRQAEAEHPLNENWLIPMPWDKLLAAEEAGKLLPKFGGLLRDLLLSMKLEDCTWQLAAICRHDGVAAVETLEWVLRSCFRVTAGTLSVRSWGRGPEGTCETELTPELPSSVVCKAAEQHSTAAAAEDGSVSAAAAVPGGLSDCLTNGLGSLVLLCNRLVHGATAAPWYQQQEEDGLDAAACSTAKHQAALLNSCLKLLVRLAFRAGGSNADARSNADSESTLSAAGRWWAVKTAAAISAFGVTLAHSGSSCSSSSTPYSDGATTTGGKDSSSKDSEFQFAVVGWSMAARSLLFVSQQLVEASECKGLQLEDFKQLLGCVRAMSGVLEEELLRDRRSLPQLQQQQHGVTAGSSWAS